MPLEIGTDLGPFRILDHIGSGGMGDVYRARDTRLGRDVAVKVLPRQYAEDPERLRRFEQEARAVAQVTHPNVLALHDVGTFEGAPYLVSELLEGESLRLALRDGPLPQRLAIQCGAQIARGLAAAHEKGIVHRDLKPDNVFLARDGHLKILDFGLAKLLRSEEPEDQETIVGGASPSTEAGKLLGTVGYMAPEQVRGQPADPRSDIFACGVILYEMVTGRPAFVRASAADTISAILREDPPESELSDRPIPPALDRVIRHCLEKRPEARFQSASDLAFDLETLSSVSLAAPPDIARAERGRRLRVALPWAVAALLGIAAILALLRPSAPRTGPREPIRLTAEIAPATEVLRGPGGSLALSPDGRTLVFAGRQGEEIKLFLRRRDRLEPVPIAGTEGGSRPFFSTDGAWIGFFSRETLWKIPATGGPPVRMGRASDPTGIAWASDGTLVFNPSWGEGLRILGPGDDEPRRLTALVPERNEGCHLWPQILPDGRNAVFTVWTKGSWEEARIEAVNLTTGERKALINGGTCGRYVASGHLLFSRGSTVLAVPFDPRRLEVGREPIPVVEGVDLAPWNGYAAYAVADDGTLAYLPARPDEAGELVWVDRSGVAQPAVADRMAFERPSLSPDGRRVATTVIGPTFHVWIHDLESGTRTRLTPEGDSGAPLWTPDGTRIAFWANLEGSYHLYWKRADGSGEVERLAATGRVSAPGSFSPDGRWLLYTEESHPQTGNDLWRLDLHGDRKASPIRQTPAAEVSPEISPDGRFVVFGSNETGRMEVFAAPFPGPGVPWQISTEGGREPRWNPAGGELFFRQQRKMMRVAIDPGPPFRVGHPELLFEGEYSINAFGYPDYDVAQDGNRFLMVRSAGGKAPDHRLVVVLDWFEEIRRRMEAGAP